MIKMMTAVVCLVALVGCGGPMTDESTGQTVGTSQQQLTRLEAPATPSDRGGRVMNGNMFRNPQEAVLLAPAFQEQQHLTNPFKGDCR